MKATKSSRSRGGREGRSVREGGEWWKWARVEVKRVRPRKGLLKLNVDGWMDGWYGWGGGDYPK